MKSLTLTDPYGRPIKSLRISLTQKCNLDCFFCHQEGEHSPGGEMAPEEVSKIVETASKLGIRKVKLTGGEPLLRPDILEIVEGIRPHVEEVSMTTNGVLLAEAARPLKESGLDRVNVSLHSLSPQGFQRITGSNALEKVLQGIEEATAQGLTPVKINTVVMKGVNDNRVEDLIEFSRKAGAVLQLIEFQALERGEGLAGSLYYDLAPLEKRLQERSTRVVERPLHRRRIYHLEGGARVEVVRPMHNTEFCMNCTRIRLTSDGKLKPCLMRNDNLVPVVELVRRGAEEWELVEAFKRCVALREPYWVVRDEG